MGSELSEGSRGKVMKGWQSQDSNRDTHHTYHLSIFSPIIGVASKAFAAPGRWWWGKWIDDWWTDWVGPHKTKRKTFVPTLICRRKKRNSHHFMQHFSKIFLAKGKNVDICLGFPRGGDFPQTLPFPKRFRQTARCVWPRAYVKPLWQPWDV